MDPSFSTVDANRVLCVGNDQSLILSIERVMRGKIPDFAFCYYFNDGLRFLKSDPFLMLQTFEI